VGQAASVCGPSNKELKRHLAVGGGVSMRVSVAARRRLTPNALGSRLAEREEVVSYELAHVTVCSPQFSMGVVGVLDTPSYPIPT